MSKNSLEVWLRGPLEGIPPLVQPAAHALLQAQEELNLLLLDFDETCLWERPSGLASVAFHLQHLSGVLDRLFTYADGHLLSPEQLADLAKENEAFIEGMDVEYLLSRFNEQVEKSIEYLKNVDQDSLLEVRGVGRNQIPSTQLGLLFHAAEHTMRHLGQLLVTIRVLNPGIKQ
jgi:uncharacterized damage-inducible protein DinB